MPHLHFPFYLFHTKALFNFVILSSLILFNSNFFKNKFVFSLYQFSKGNFLDNSSKSYVFIYFLFLYVYVLFSSHDIFIKVILTKTVSLQPHYRHFQSFTSDEIHQNIWWCCQRQNVGFFQLWFSVFLLLWFCGLKSWQIAFFQFYCIES